MSQNGGNREQMEAATRTAMAATIVTSTALYLIYKKKLVQCNGYNNLARFKQRCWKNNKICMFLLFIIICSFIILKSSGFPSSINFPTILNLDINLTAIDRKQEKKYPTKYNGVNDEYNHTSQQNTMHHAQQPHNHNFDW